MISEIALFMVMILGFNNGLNITDTLIISSMLGLFALGVTWLMTVQGINFAEDIPENKKVMKEYNDMLVDNPKVLKSHGMGRFWVKKIILDIFMKGILLGVTTGVMLTFFISGSGD